MNRWIKIVIGLSVLSVIMLTAAWQHYVYAPLRTQAEFRSLMDDAAPILKRRKAERRVQSTGFDAYKTALRSLEPRFAKLNSALLSPCEQEDLYRNWGALRLWSAWAKNRSVYDSPPSDPILVYQETLAQFTGRPVSFEDVKAVGEAEYAAVQTELKTLQKRVLNDYNQTLDEFAVRQENFSTSANDIIARATTTLTYIEDKFADLEDFDFAAVPKGSIQTQEGYGPRYSIASYLRNDNAMRLYWTYGRYNHMYDTMLAVHEIMPGHHLQISMETRRACGKGPISAAIPMLEGWATYAEFLADERGLFDPPDQRLGWLDYRLMRAMRIIMDTARLEQNYTENQAWKLWQDKMPRRLDDDFPREWARINASPHHLSYIFGSQAILSTRQQLRQTMGLDYDEAEFHAALLNAPHKHLMFLAERLEAQIKARRLMETNLENTIETAL